jgi:hypothetical protein
MYGPPPDAAQVLIDVPWSAWAISVVVGVLCAVAAARCRGQVRLALGTLAGTTLLTAPMLGMIPVGVFGSYPTIDKAGSLHFFRESVHWHLGNAADPAVQLIGVHLGHLWIVELFSRVMPDWAGFNAQSFLNLWLAWLCTSNWVQHRAQVHGPRRGAVAASVLLAIPFAMNLHQFRDINWYTVEKTSIFVLPLWLLCVDKRRSVAAALTGALAMFLNVYMGILIAAMGAWMVLGVVLRRGRDWSGVRPVLATAVGMLPFVVWQAVLMRGAHAPGSPDAFLHQRAALDVVSIVPWQWNRLEGWRTMSFLVLGLALSWSVTAVLWRGTGRGGSLWALAGAVVAVGIALGPTENPLYMALFDFVPGFWRVAKPETFFFIPWLLAVTAATEAIGPLSRRGVALLGAVTVLGWLWGVRSHPVYPNFYARPPLPEAHDSRP